MKTQDIKTFSDQLLKTMKEQLDIIAEEHPEAIARTSKSLLIVKSCLNELKRFIHQYQFQGKQEEIKFFKEIKPVFTSQFHFYEKMLSIKLSEPVGNHEVLMEFYCQGLKNIQAFANQHPDFFKYCLTNATHFDDTYFIRQDNLLANPDTDEKFSTGYDNLLATMLADQMLKDYLLSSIKNAGSESDNGSRSYLTWTGPKTYLIELVYALQSAEAFNNGKADIKQIASAFENIFNISLGNYYRVYQEIRLRKNGKSYFLDQLKDKFLQRMDELDQH